MRIKVPTGDSFRNVKGVLGGKTVTTGNEKKRTTPMNTPKFNNSAILSFTCVNINYLECSRSLFLCHSPNNLRIISFFWLGV